ncbi:hypothetical protein OAR37_02985 [Flavobacteriaceae bacterium]|uniref:hypothetical protein n=1 Tax=Candidatus Arcticimaribacter forsetii TaxID=2820661 RepID=UPI00207754F2|nr:hypothetical protein [Candidatus Arcticimaribacter forsetii]MDB2326212.1 hypothetical protein [Flavobacteriaceae bacterium]MDB2345900.1 hypothetical protein [Flavobacteriaceae bacterium]MDB4620863.1 hypothetical protein [Flavobacteriaceae bacterium]MDB4716672.1 hypothetical protein [Flavobacteriaceae bacterium]MDC0960379.1 hypothetical protein [Flavobacteriaceae bacterium]
MILKIYGNEFVASAHDIDSKQLTQLGNNPSQDEIMNLIPDYDVSNTNYFFINRPLINDILSFEVYDGEENVWKGNLDDFTDIYDHGDNYPEIMDIDLWDEQDEYGDAVAWDEHPQFIYYEEINKGLVGIVKIDCENFDPEKLSCVCGSLEKDDDEPEFLDKIYYEQNLLQWIPLEDEPKNISTLFSIIS